MRITKHLILSLLLLVLLTGFASAQEAGTFHLFPMVTAGELPDGSEWDGAFIVTNVDGRPTTCSLELVGMPLTNTEGQGSLASQGSVQIAGLEAGRVPPGVEVGYGIIACDHAVTATFLQVFDPVGEAPDEGIDTIHPAAPSLVASIPILDKSLTVAIVNDTSVAANFDVTVFSDQLVGTTRVNIPAKSQLVEGIADLVQELSAEAVDFTGSIIISSVDNSTPFYALGMFRAETILATVAATQLDTTSSTETVLIANFLNGNNAVLNSRVYLFNGSNQAGDITVRVFTLPVSGSIRQELTTTPLNLGSLGAKEGFNIKLDVDILAPLGMGLPYTTDGGNLTVEFTIGAENVHGVAQVFSSELAFGTYPMQVIQ